MLDTLISNGLIIDGTGAPWFRGHIGIQGGRIAGIWEQDPPNAAQIINADGGFIAPGFIDVHTHDDIAFLRNAARPEKIVQGVTTIVTGNCSFSNYPAPEDLNVAGVAEHLETLLGPISRDEIFPNFAEYVRALEQQKLGPNLVSLVGHGPIRIAVMGFESRQATPVERLEMEKLLDLQLSQGAAGLSIGLVYTPGSWADDAELLGLAHVVARHGRLLAAHIRNYDYAVEAAIEEFIALLKRSGCKGLLSHLQVCGRENWGKMPALLERLEVARKDGVDIACDMYPYTAGSSTILQLLPPSALEGGSEAILRRLTEPQSLSNIRKAVVDDRADDPSWRSKVGQIGWGNIRIGGVEVESHRHYEGKSFAEIAQDQGRDAFEIATELMVCDCCRTNLVMFQQDEVDLRKVLSHRLFMAGSDSIPREGGRPHPRGSGTFTRLIGTYAFGENLSAIEEMVRHMTSMPAQRFGLWDRGTLRPGMVADIVLFNVSVLDQATYAQPRLEPTGIEKVIVAGEVVVEAGRITKARTGKVLLAVA